MISFFLVGAIGITSVRCQSQNMSPVRLKSLGIRKSFTEVSSDEAQGR